MHSVLSLIFIQALIDYKKSVIDFILSSDWIWYILNNYGMHERGLVGVESLAELPAMLF